MSLKTPNISQSCHKCIIVKDVTYGFSPIFLIICKIDFQQGIYDLIIQDRRLLFIHLASNASCDCILVYFRHSK